ncbi:hypothetical protein MKX01_016303 [Papaver californicum]|nr:hypothetical protein MKX01_016303 [Papaver californicum]
MTNAPKFQVHTITSLLFQVFQRFYKGIRVMGQAMTTRLISAGYSLTVYARTPKKASSLQKQKGATIVNSPSDVANKSHVMFTMVDHPPDVRSIVLGDNGVLSGLNKGGVFIDTISSDPVLAKEIASKAQSKGCFAIDSPVSGGDIGARDGKLAIFVDGDSDVVKWLAPASS